MARRNIRPTGSNVLVGARERLRITLEDFDNTVVLFSGGKDSLVCLKLVREAKLAAGDNSPVHAVFWDREFFVKPLIDFVEEVHGWDWVDLKWVCVKREQPVFSFEGSTKVICWDSNREWARTPPKWAIHPEAPTPNKGDQEWTLAGMYEGSLAAINGLRAVESMNRFRAIVNCNPDEAHLARTACPAVMMVRPIYDWVEKDVYKFIYEDPDIDLPYVYQLQYIVGMGLRTSTVTHRNAAKYLDRVAQIDPDLYEAILRIIPDVKLQALYWSELDIGSIIAQYGNSYVGVRRWLDENVESEYYTSALRTFENAMGRVMRSPWAYTPELMLKHFLYGQFSGYIQPSHHIAKVRKKKYDV